MSAVVAVSAREQLDRIKQHWSAFWFEVKAFYDAESWRELGYASFVDCMETELGVSGRQAYRLLEAATVRENLSNDGAVTTSDNLKHLTLEQAHTLKVLSPSDQVAVAQLVDFAVVTAPELRAIVKPFRLPPPVLRKIPENKFECESCGALFDEPMWHCPDCQAHNGQALTECAACHHFGPNGPTESGQGIAMEWTLAIEWKKIEPEFLKFAEWLVVIEETYGPTGSIGPNGLKPWVGEVCRLAARLAK